MKKFEWNTLRVGDDVLVHDPDNSELALLAGVVAVVDTHKGQNGVGIRALGTASVMLWPARLAVHGDPRDLTESCWRCDTRAVGVS